MVASRAQAAVQDMTLDDVSAADSNESELESAIADLYSGPLEDFVRRRDALAKALRTAGRRDSATLVKNLRKPSRLAWGLDLAARDGSGVIDTLNAAVAEMLDAQSASGDTRGAIVRLRAAVREFAGQAARAAEQAGHRVEVGALANAVLAVLGKPETFDQLRRGSLADIPEAGGLDFLAALPTPAAQVPREASAQPLVAREAAAPAPDAAELEAAARDAVRQAGSGLVAARERSDVSQRALRDAESRLQGAETRLREAEAEARDARHQHERALEEADTLVAQLRAAENALAEAEQRLQRILNGGVE